MPQLCIGQTNPVVFNLEIEGNRLKNPTNKTYRMKVKQNDDVIWQITSDNSGEFHLHAYGIEVKVPKNVLTKYRFIAKATGKFQVEWHPNSGISQTQVGSHQTPLAYFEVYPQ